MKRRVWTSAPWLIISICIIFGMAIAVYRFEPLISFIGGGVAIVLLVLSIIFRSRYRRYVTKTLDSALNSIGKVEKNYLDRFKVPVALAGKYGDIVWSNSRFKKQLCSGRDPSNEDISPYIGAKEIGSVADSDGFEIDFNGKHFLVLCTSVDEGYACFYIDNTDYFFIYKKYLETQKSVALISFDNQDEFSNDSEEESARVLLALETKLLHFADENKALFKTLPSNKYMMILDNSALDKLIADKFPILKEIRTIKFNNREATVSIGIGMHCETLVESETKARKALDMALGRGGDQVAVMKDDTYEFFGGVSAGIEKMSKVRSRVIATSIARVVSEADRVYIMGHRFSDLDCVGAAVGLQPVIENVLKKQCRIVLNRGSSMAKRLVSLVENSGSRMFITPDEALKNISGKTLIIVVDTHIRDMVESPELLSKCSHVVVIDHHRKMVNYIDDAVIFYHEPTASSASEMVAELITYIGDAKISKLQAEALLSGIMLDTKNFVVRTGVRTFEAAAFLRKHGADTVETKELFAGSLENYKQKYKLVNNAEIYHDCAISIADGESENIRVVAAQAADELLSVENVVASFVVFENNGGINISARSYGKLNVQLVMENLGGGGHQNMAAAQLKGLSPEETKQKLITAIDSVIQE
ncbi:MAG: DHH family phosphoesterase [Ruminococcus sp.]|nr:DHH family phosphoesterase [Ruminococcus sp.]